MLSLGSENHFCKEEKMGGCLACPRRSAWPPVGYAASVKALTSLFCIFQILNERAAKELEQFQMRNAKLQQENEQHSLVCEQLSQENQQKALELKVNSVTYLFLGAPFFIPY